MSSEHGWTIRNVGLKWLYHKFIPESTPTNLETLVAWTLDAITPTQTSDIPSAHVSRYRFLAAIHVDRSALLPDLFYSSAASAWWLVGMVLKPESVMSFATPTGTTPE
ncbi:hypothetical protein J1614_007737 [Plenodomus biglobosus]|nr:hypothetical protein J1614_007737 [Plenodomus biglobosus]